MLSPEQERCPPSRARFWLTHEGLYTFMAMVQRLAPNEIVEQDRAREQLHLALRASDFVEPLEVDNRVYEASRVLAERLQAETYRIARHRQFVTQPQPFRPNVVYGESDGPVRDSLDNHISTTSQHSHFARYLKEQVALNRPSATAAKSTERYSDTFT